MKYSILFITVFFLSVFSTTAQQKYKYPFLNPSLDVEMRAKDLVSRLSLDEKISQMMFRAPAVERLGIPSYNWWNECLHGVARAGQATVFPQGIGMAAMFDDDYMYRIADVISTEARAKHHEFVRQGKRNIYQGLTFWTPNINIFRDPRWGRGQETYGEDPYLTGKLGVAFVKGLQGNDSKYLKAIATVKHFAVHSGPEPLRHEFNAKTSDKDLVETYLPAFEMIVKEADVQSVMCAYNRFRDEPCCGSNELLQTYLRDKWGFNGYVVSDCWAISDFYQYHKTFKDKSDASAYAVKGGTDLECGESYEGLRQAVRDKLITEKEIDKSLIRLFIARIKLGMFDPDNMVKYAQIPISALNTSENQQVAFEAARKSVVLLKNDGLLPLKKSVKNVAVIGPVANDDETLWGNYAGYNKIEVTILDGIKDKLPNANIRFEVGCELSENFPQIEPVPASVLFTSRDTNSKGVKAEYYNNPSLWGKPEVALVENDINHVWWEEAPHKNIPADNFGAKYETYIRIPETGRYALGTEGFYGYKFWVNDSLVFTFGNEHHPRKKFFLQNFKAGEMVKVNIEYRHEFVNHAMMKLLWGRSDNAVLVKRAIDAAKKSDVVILCMGINQNLEGEEMTVKTKGFAGGDRTEITLPETQQQLIKEIKKLGKPTVLVLQNGSPLSIPWEDKNISAIVEGWYGGQSAGTAIADVLFGDYNPAGRLPVTVYKSLDQLGDFEDYSMKGKTYRYFTGTPLYEFGYGLSYSKFQYSNLNCPQQAAIGKPVEISVDVTNTGKMDGEEVVQLYLSHKGYSFDTPIRSLKGFKRIALKKGETKKVSFTLQPNDMAVVGDNGTLLLNPCDMQVSIGGKQPDAVSQNKKEVLVTSIKLGGSPAVFN